MKRVMLAALLLVGSVSVFATENASDKNEEKKIEWKVEEQKGECTYTISAKIGPSWGQVEVKCSYTASTCKEAITQANSCIEEAKKAIIK